MCPAYKGYISGWGWHPVSRWADAFRTAHEGAGRDAVDPVDTVATPYRAPEPLWPDPGTPERTRLDERNAAIVTGYRRAALKRPPSWSDSAALPSPGCWCSCCDGQRWWSEADGPKGWRCWTCHPGDHLTAAERREVRTALVERTL